ncbi:formate dehydrogenase accessory sulfurtransferase FdhD [Xinfangfangia sp. CPCC 101601]|uniref:Sulfur carrier protein FdhD n=1 Tax=Pseudogemmobacter lacusdianii TaxID=3069608 RepID=A0ABU0VWV3_9RHOB|nr:formate dehydrogenase accessory sulfurtransferase FdhD [Xinfangfangia sp. CPCC 101601]MDQ2066222.1 formate dehydrogenase accessory sulfurtransferase FdhD [Xinfangfangia sp. CPCC 101601]
MIGARPIPRLAFGPAPLAGERMLSEERAVALSFNGSTQAVMMATPADLVDFAYGFALTEGIAVPTEVESVEVVETEGGIDVQCWLVPEAEARLAARRRTMAGPVGCGLCGIDSIAEAVREPEPVPHGGLRMTPSQVMAAIAALPQFQPLHDVTRSAHCAGFWTGGALAVTREDVGRHNALDKLAGWALRSGADCAQGAVVLTSRVSIDLVQKVAALRCGIVIAVSAPTADAVALAERAGITLIALARPDRFEAFTHTDRIVTEPAHVGHPR